jgi:hypothetical protein
VNTQSPSGHYAIVMVLDIQVADYSEDGRIMSAHFSERLSKSCYDIQVLSRKKIYDWFYRMNKNPDNQEHVRQAANNLECRYIIQGNLIKDISTTSDGNRYVLKTKILQVKGNMILLEFSVGPNSINEFIEKKLEEVVSNVCSAIKKDIYQSK